MLQNIKFVEKYIIININNYLNYINFFKNIIYIYNNIKNTYILEH